MTRKKTGPSKRPATKSRREAPKGSSGTGKTGKAGLKTAGKVSAKVSAKKSGAKRRPPRPQEAPDAARPLTAADKGRLLASKASAEAAIDAALDKKGLLPVLMDVSGRASYTDFIAIVSGRSDRQVEAIAENVIATMKGRGWPLLGREGNGNGRWTLLDFGDVVVHVFYHPVREFYDIESLWIDAPRVKLNVPPEATHFQEESLFYDSP